MHAQTFSRLPSYPQNMYREKVKPSFASMADAIEDLRAPSKMYQDKPGRYIQWNLGMPEWEELMGVAFAEREPSREGLQTNLQYPWYDLFDYELDGHRLEQHGRQRRISRAPPLPYHFAMSSEWIDKVCWLGLTLPCTYAPPSSTPLQPSCSALKIQICSCARRTGGC